MYQCKLGRCLNLEGHLRRLGLAGVAKALAAGALTDLLVLVFVVLAHAVSASPGLLLPAELLLGGFALLAGGALVLGAAYAYLRFPAHRKALIFIAALTLAVFSAHMYVVNLPSQQDACDAAHMFQFCIGDESYYLPAAHAILSGGQCVPSVTSCKPEHPILSQALIAGGIAVFGDDPTGWRIMPILLGTSSIPLLYLLSLKITSNRRLSCIAALMLALDVNFFVLSSAAFLDVPMVFFVLTAFLAYFYELRVWKLDRFMITGTLLGLAGLAKETAILPALALLTYHILFGGGSGGSRVDLGRHHFISRLATGLIILVVAGVTFAIGVQVYDSLYASTPFPLFIDQVRYMLGNTAGHVGQGYTCGPGSAPITAYDWLTYYCPTQYYTSMTLGAGFYDVAYMGISNMAELWMTFAWVPLAAGVLVASYRRRRSLQTSTLEVLADEASSGERRFLALTLSLFLWNYVPYVLLTMVGLTTYPFYLLPGMPAVALGIGYLLSQRWFPRSIAILYLVVVFGFFLVFFPYKGFLPDWLKAVFYY